MNNADSSPAGSNDGLHPEEQLRARIAELEAELAELREDSDRTQRNERIFELITENVTDMIAVIDPEGRRLWNNRAYLHTLGFTPEELSGSFSMLEIHPEDKDRVGIVFQESMRTGIGRKIEYRMRHKNGFWVNLESQAQVVNSDSGEVECMVVVARDISDRKSVESTGVPRNVAHEFNNLLTAILGNLAMARMMAEDQDDLARHLVEAEKAAMQSRKVLGDAKRLPAESGDSKSSPQAPTQPSGAQASPEPQESKLPVVPLLSLIPEVANQTAKGGLGRLQVHLPPKLLSVRGDTESIKEMLQAVMRNAVQAMTSRGIIRVEARNINIDSSATQRALALGGGRYVFIEIRDQGGGIPVDLLERVFEPHFTTRKGANGMGLTDAKAIARQHGGTITVSSKKGSGTVACIYLASDAEVTSPSSPEDGSPTRPRARNLVAPPAAGTTAGTREEASVKRRILFMDDEPLVREFAQGMLKHLGYDVVMTADGNEAIQVLAENQARGQSFDLIIMDLIVPNGLGGQNALAPLRQIDPEVKLIVTSGYTDHPLMTNYAAYGFVGAIEKPFSMRSVSEMLQSVLGDT